MTLSLQEMSDRFEIQDLMVGYCYAVDDRDFDALDHYFTDDAVIDYTEMVPVKGSLTEIKEFLRASLAPITNFQHAVSTTHNDHRARERNDMKDTPEQGIQASGLQ